MPPDKDPNRDAAAIDALIAFNLAHSEAENLTDEEILEASINGPFSEEARKIILNYTPKTSASIERSPVHAEETEMAGMYREGSDETLDKKVKEEIERRRAELRERLRRKEKGDV